MYFVENNVNQVETLTKVNRCQNRRDNIYWMSTTILAH